MEKLIVVAGAGSYPRLVVEGARRSGVTRVEVMAVAGSTDRATMRAADSFRVFGIGKIASAMEWIASAGADGVILAGQVNPLSLFRSRFDDQTLAWLAELPCKNAHSVFGKLIDEFSRRGVKVLPASLFMDDNLPGVGCLTKRGLTETERQDVGHAIEVARDVGIHDVGQTVMVKSGMVLAVEAFEGTNAAIRRGGRLGGKGSVVFKAAREGHDMRFDIPVVGMKTLKVMKKAGVTALAFQAGRLILLDRAEVIDFADRNSIALVGIDSGLPPAPLRV